MDQNDKLREEYEEALFRLLMAKAAQAEGEEIEQEIERLKNDPYFTVPRETDRKCEKALKKALSRGGLRSRLKKAGRVFQKAAVAVSLLLVVAVTAYAAIPRVRDRVLELVVETSDVDSRLSFTDVEYDPDNVLMGYVITALPEGFEKTYEIVEEKAGTMEYMNGDDVIYFDVRVGNESTLSSHDKDDESTKEIKVNGYDALFTLVNDGRMNVVWVDTENTVLFELSSVGLEENEVLNMAESVRYVG